MNNLVKLTLLVNGIQIEYFGMFYDDKTDKVYLAFNFYSNNDFKSDFVVTDTFNDILIKIHIGQYNGIDKDFLHNTITELSKYYHYLINYNKYIEIWEVYKYLIALYGTANIHFEDNLIEVHCDLETPKFETKLNNVEVKVYANKHNEKHLKEGFKMFLESEYK